MQRNSGPKQVRLDVLGDYLELDLLGVRRFTCQAELPVGAWGAGRIGFTFNTARVGGKFYELNTASRLSADGVTTAAIDCAGYARVRAEVVVVTATANSFVSLFLHGYSELSE